MKRIAVFAVAIGAALLGASSASAFTEVGDNCSAMGEFFSEGTVLQAEEASQNVLGLAAPSSGVVT